MTELFVGHGAEISLHFKLSLEDGSVLDSTFDNSPGVFSFGDGTLPSGIESLIQGMKAGERKHFTVPPEKGFGMPNPNNVQSFARDQFPNIDDLEIGMVISFADANKAELPGVISLIEENQVEVDFNHPLAGRTLGFEVEIISIRPLGED